MLLKTSRRTFLKGLTLSGVAGSLGKVRISRSFLPKLTR
ncbi:twin-arginine translocation signal domain-containing protein [Klebsiella pneumoniae]|nr:twin-arginine translocation signal domain-containing protein [Klebsiella pneumoniae]MCX9995777.1 twin-arginine translocation signal domain-containing protein [Klebsiella pneumoniae]